VKKFTVLRSIPYIYRKVERTAVSNQLRVLHNEGFRDLHRLPGIFRVVTHRGTIWKCD
jgi:hypothetical protein